ncbi:MAG: polyketide cyclase [Bdellovibrionales bacterium]|nr:polyketide cyclase [Bdellovibrionales bacterium]
MSSAEATEVFHCSKQEFWQIITDYQKYPTFLQEVNKCEVLSEQGGKKLVEYTVNLIKTFKYKLWMDESEGPDKLSWNLDSGDLFKVSNGSWVLKEEAGKTRATYFVEAKFKVFVPGPVSKALVNVNMPNMMSSYHKRVRELYGK